jgi:hypothetical protein
VPLAQAFALYAAISARYDREASGPNYFEREMLKRLEAAGHEAK